MSQQVYIELKDQFDVNIQVGDIDVSSTNPIPIDGSGVIQPISVASLPLPTGASTEAKQDTGNASLVSIDSKLGYVERRVDRTNKNAVYYGETHTLGALESDSVWRIWRVGISGFQEHTPFASDVATESKRWDLRTTYFPAIAFYNNYSTNFDGVNDYLTGGNVFNYDNANQWSISMWIRADNFAATRCLFSKTTNDANVFGWGLYVDTGANLFLQMRASGQLTSHTGVATLSALTWYHIVMTYNGGQNISGVRFYVNAVVGTTPTSAVVTNTLLYSQDFLIGRRGSAFHFSGYMDEISVWNKALSASEVSLVYNSGTPRNPASETFATNLVSHYRMGDSATYPTIPDQIGPNNLTMTNMDPGDFETVVP